MNEKWSQVIEEVTRSSDESLAFLMNRYTSESVSNGLDTVATVLGFYLAAVTSEQHDSERVAGRYLIIYVNTLCTRIRDWENITVRRSCLDDKKFDGGPFLDQVHSCFS
jgi:hypothetical protein